jgi:hypothetical protein
MWRPWLIYDKRFWAATGASLLLLAALIGWGVRSHQRSRMQQALNAFAPFHTPPLELAFPQIIADSAAARAILEPGVRKGLWTLRRLGGNPPTVAVMLSSQGERWFSVVGKQVVATFQAGSRQATAILDLEDTFPSRRVRFRYVWQTLHIGTNVLGPEMPLLGTEYEGDAIFFYENDQWRLLHWTTPQFDFAVKRFKTLQSG